MSAAPKNPRRVLIIAYYFPPLGGSGVQRPLKMARYLKEFGWEPVVLTPEPGAYYHFDQSLEDEIEKHRIEVERVSGSTIFHAGGMRKVRVKPAPWKAALLKLMTAWFFLPDNKTGWIGPAYRRALELHNKQPFDAIFSTAPPYSNLMLACRIKAAVGIPVIMDFRDEWLRSHWISYPTRFHFRKMKQIEQQTLSCADAITVVNESYSKSFGERAEPAHGIYIIPNGYDPDYFENDSVEQAPEGSFTLLHSGRFYNTIRPDTLLAAVAAFRKNNPGLAGALRLKFQGGLEQKHLRAVRKYGLSEITTDTGYLPHEKAAAGIRSADCLFITLPDAPNMEEVTPGKIFEYMGSRKPILAELPEGAGSELLKKYGAAEIVPPGDAAALAKAIERMMKLWQEKKLPAGDAKFARRFSRRAQAGELAKLLSVCVGEEGG